MQVNVAFRCTAEVQVKIDRRHNERRLSHSAQSRRTAALVFGHRRQWALRVNSGFRGADAQQSNLSCQRHQADKPTDEIQRRSGLSGVPRAPAAVPPAPTFAPERVSVALLCAPVSLMTAARRLRG